MDTADTLRILLADLILVVHFSFVLFVVAGFACIVGGRFAGWRWIYNAAFRFTHLGAIGVVVLQSWLGKLCPLTIWESALRAGAGQAAYAETFVQHWLQRLLYYDFDFRLFVVVYSVFGAFVAIATFVDWDRIRSGP